MKIILLCFVLFILASVPNVLGCTGYNTSQISALKDLYNSAGGVNWKFSPNVRGNVWFSTNDYCSWKGVKCDNGCNYVTGLFLNETGMVGQLPPSFTDFVWLEYLNLTYNFYLGGNIPETMLTSFQYLTSLYIGGTALGGMLTGAGGACTSNFHFLDLTGMTNLSGYDLSRCKFLISVNIGYSATGSYLNFPISSSPSSSYSCYFPQLTYLKLDGTFTSTYAPNPPSHFDLSCLCNSTFIEYLDVTRNGLTGTIPGCLSTLSHLKTFIASGNSFTGIDMIGRYYSLTLFDVANNKISQDFSTLDFQSLTTGFFGGNQFYGTIRFTTSYYLEVLSLTNNKFVGDFPNNIIQLPPFLQYVDLRGNPGMSYTNNIFVPSTTMMVGDYTNGSGHGYELCPALTHNQPSDYPISILVSPSYYDKSPVKNTMCIVLNNA